MNSRTFWKKPYQSWTLLDRRSTTVDFSCFNEKLKWGIFCRCHFAVMGVVIFRKRCIGKRMLLVENRGIVFFITINRANLTPAFAIFFRWRIKSYKWNARGYNTNMKIIVTCICDANFITRKLLHNNRVWEVGWWKFVITIMCSI